MDPAEALRHVLTMIRVAKEADDPEAILRILDEMERIVKKGLADPARP